MKVLLDQGTPAPLRKALPDHMQVVKAIEAAPSLGYTEVRIE